MQHDATIVQSDRQGSGRMRSQSRNWRVEFENDPPRRRVGDFLQIQDRGTACKQRPRSVMDEIIRRLNIGHDLRLVEDAVRTEGAVHRGYRNRRLAGAANLI